MKMIRERIDFIIANSSGFIEACQRIAKESYREGYLSGLSDSNEDDDEVVYRKMAEFING